MNVSNLDKLVLSVKKILKYFAHTEAKATDVSVSVARIYHWRNEVFRRHVAQAKRIFI
ncbi:hypothetical protein [Romboutsia ilealis]|uniref:hypothetical protein n=1 Tax=Romboutsia ilealis TaxID=1115758 RepID=UPI0025A5E042|nr:hypothetical protein [Romboutsia ilealis]